jgi:hypothetical protein
MASAGAEGRVMQETDSNKPQKETRAAAITQALLRDDATAAAMSIAEAAGAGDVTSVASALAFALAEGEQTNQETASAQQQQMPAAGLHLPTTCTVWELQVVA